MKLREGLHEGGLDCGGFLGAELVRPGESFLGSLYGGCGRAFVDGLFLDCHVDKDVHTLLRDFDESFADREVMRLPVLDYDQFARHELSHERDVHWVNADLTLDRWEDDHLDIVTISL